MRKIFSTIFTVFICVSLFITNTFAQEMPQIEKLTAAKTATPTDKVGEYKVQISVPGNESERIEGYNVIIVIDASTSINGTKWTNTRKAVLDMVEVLLPEEKQEDNFNHVALMTFGMGSHINIPLTNDISKFKNLPKTSGVSLLEPGRSATNNEVGLRGAREYIESLKGTSLERSPERNYIIYLSDGASNLNEEPINYYDIAQKETNVKIGGKYYNSLDLQKDGVITALIYFDSVIKTPGYENVTRNSLLDKSLAKLKNEYFKIHPEDTEASVDKMFYVLNNEAEEAYTKLLLELINDFYDSIGYDKTKSYSAGDYERMVNKTTFIDRSVYAGYKVVEDGYEFIVANTPVLDGIELDKVNAVIEDIFYMPIFYNGTNRTVNAKRAIEEGNKLAKLGTIYTIGFNASREDALTILDPNYKANEGIQHFSSGYTKTSAQTINEVFKTLVADIITINYANVEVEDYTSKWVIPKDTNGDGIFDAKDITIKNGNNIISNPENYVTVEEISESIYNASNDEQIKGNTNDKIYRITWKIADYLRKWDKFTLSYLVQVDTQETGFISNIEYKANGKTTLKYDLVEKLEQEETFIASSEEDITVPTVKQAENILVITKKDNKDNLLSGADFEITGEGTNQVKKEYSKDGNTWTETNENATHFKFSGLYNYNYTLKETKTPEGYISISNKEIDFTNRQESQEAVNITVVNRKEIYGKVIAKYVDEDGNALSENVVITGLVDDTYETKEKVFEDYELIKINGNKTGLITEDTIEVVYIYQYVMGQGDIMPPNTGVEKEYSITSIFTTISLLGMLIILKRNQQ